MVKRVALAFCLLAAIGGSTMAHTRMKAPINASISGAITEPQWDAAAKHLVAALDKYNVPKAEKDEFMAFVATQKKDIVEHLKR